VEVPGRHRARGTRPIGGKKRLGSPIFAGQKGEPLEANRWETGLNRIGFGFNVFDVGKADEKSDSLA
jgi:hypothetical protein